MNEAIFKTLKQKDYIVKGYLFKIATELRLSLNEMLLLIYFMNQDRPVLDLSKIENDMYLKKEEILEAYSKLLKLNIIKVKVKKVNDIVEETINLDSIIESVTTELSRSLKQEKETNLFEKFESEFGRTLSPTEYEIINSWLDDKVSEELIIEALREATFNGAKSLRYIERILLNWKEKGIKTSNDVRKNKTKEVEKIVIDDFDMDFDWVNADE